MEKEIDKTEIINMALDCNLTTLYKSQLTFNKVINILEKLYGYEIESGRQSFDKKQHTYKLIVSFDEEKISFDKPCSGIDK
jgi:hypothetical protein